MAAVAFDNNVATHSRHIVLYVHSHGCDAIGYPVRSFLPPSVYEKINATMYYESPSHLCSNLSAPRDIEQLKQIFSLPLPYLEKINLYMNYKQKINIQTASIFSRRPVGSVYTAEEYEQHSRRYAFSVLQKAFFQKQQQKPVGINRLYNFARNTDKHRNFGLYVLYDSMEAEHSIDDLTDTTILKFDDETQQWRGNTDSSMVLVHELHPAIMSKLKDGKYLTLSSMLYAIYEALEDNHIVLSIIDGGCRTACRRFTEKILHPEETEFAEMIAEQPELQRTESYERSIQVPMGFPMGKKYKKNKSKKNKNKKTTSKNKKTKSHII